MPGSRTRFSWKFSAQCYMIFSLFLRCPRLNCVHSSMPKLKLSLTIKADDVKTGRKEVDPLRWLWAAEGQMS